MAEVLKTVDKTLVVGNEIFIYTVNASYSGLVIPSQNGYLTDFFPSKIKYTLPPIGGQIQSITETPTLGGTIVRFNFGAVTSGTSISFTIACSFGPGRVQGDTFTNSAQLFADNVNVATGIAPTVTLQLNEDFRLFKNVDGSSLLRPGEEKTFTLTLGNAGDFGSVINNIVITDTLPAGLTPVASFLPVGNDVPFGGYSDPTYNGLTGTWVGNTLNFVLPSYQGVRYDITFKATVDNNVTPGQSIINTAKWTVGGVSRADAVLNMRVWAPSDAFSFTKAGTRTGMVGSPIVYGIANNNIDIVSYNNYVLEDTLPPEVDVNMLRFNSNAAGLPSYNLYVSLASAPATFIPLVIGGQGNTGNIDLTPITPLGDRIAKIRLTAPVLNFGPTSYHSFNIFGIINNKAQIGQVVINTATASADGIMLTASTGTDINGLSDLAANKIITPVQAAYFPLEEFSVEVNGGAVNTITVNPVLGDLLPVGLEYVLDSEYFVYRDFQSGNTYDSRVPGFPVPLPTREIIDDYQNTGSKLLRWRFNFILPNNNNIGVVFKAFVRINPPSTFTNIGFEGNPGKDVLFVYDAKTDVLDLDGDDIVDELISIVERTGVILTTSEFSLNKLVKGAFDLDYETLGTTFAGGDVSYRLQVTNNQVSDLKDIEIVDILPYVGDTGVILTDEARGSQFAVYATGEVTAEVINLLNQPVLPPPIITIEYSTSNDPVRFDELGNPIGTGTWSTTPPVDITMLRSVKVTTDPSTILKPYERLIVTINAKAPVGATPGLIAYNSFAVRADEILNGQTTPMLPTEPNKVGVRIQSDELGSIGHLVWFDENGDGLYQVGEPGVNGVNVYLYNSQMQQIASTVTSNDIGNNPGYYRFGNLPAGNYYVRFVPSSAYSITVQMAAAPNGSKPNPLTGLTDVIALAVGEDRTDINAGLIQACSPPVIVAKDRCIKVGSTFNPMQGVSATDCHGNNITEDIIITQNTVNTAQPGLYEVTYQVTDALENTTVKTIRVAVCPNNPRAQAVTDLISSVSLQEAALAHVLNAEGEKIQKAAALNYDHNNLIGINRSVTKTIKNITGLELVLTRKLSLFNCRLCSDQCCENTLRGE